MAEDEKSKRSFDAGKGLVFIAGLNLIGLAGVFFFLGIQLEQMDSRVDEAEKELSTRIIEKTAQAKTKFLRVPSLGPVVSLGSIRTTLRTSEEDTGKLVRLNLVVELDSEATRQEAEQKVSQLRYHLARFLSSREISSVKSEALIEVRKAMTRRADAVLSSRNGRVLNVWPRGWSFAK